MSIELTEEQLAAVDEILKFKKNITKISGYAGTGKSSVISYLYENELPNFAVCAFTGKAASVLRKKGILTASTIHSLIYELVLGMDGKPKLDDNGLPEFRLKTELPVEGIIVDEASMVSKELFKDLCSFGKPIIFCGDHGQLEPIGESINLMTNPDITLETINRNAGEIAYFAEYIRKGYRAASWKSQGKVKFIDRYDVEKYYSQVDQVICAYNKTRVEINKIIREQKGYDPKWPVVGDRVICLRNNNKTGLFNGMQGNIIHLFKKPRNKMTFSTEEMDYDVTFDPKIFNVEKPEINGDRDGPSPFEFSYAITCHKAQGDQFSKIMVIEQKCKLWDHKKWAYTAASRAENEIFWVSGN